MQTRPGKTPREDFPQAAQRDARREAHGVSPWVPTFHPPMMLLLLIALGGLLGGCAGQQVQPVANPYQIDAQAYRPVFATAVQVLRDQGFTVDRRDFRFGVITTRPLGASTLFEPWTGDHTTADQAIAGTLHDHQRIVRITLEPAAQLDEESLEQIHAIQLAVAEDDALPPAVHAYPDYWLHVEVLIEQRQLPARRLIGASGRDVFTSLDDVPQEWRQRGIEREYWRPIGRDPYLENRLLNTILQKAAAAPAPAAEDETP